VFNRKEEEIYLHNAYVQKKNVVRLELNLSKCVSGKRSDDRCA